MDFAQLPSEILLMNDYGSDICFNYRSTASATTQPHYQLFGLTSLVGYRVSVDVQVFYLGILSVRICLSMMVYVGHGDMPIIPPPPADLASSTTTSHYLHTVWIFVSQSSCVAAFSSFLIWFQSLDDPPQFLPLPSSLLLMMPQWSLWQAT